MREYFALKVPFLYDGLLNFYRKIVNALKDNRWLSSLNRSCSCVSGGGGRAVGSDDCSVIFLFAVHWFAPSGAEYYALECARIAKQEGAKVIWIVDFPSCETNWLQEFLEISDHSVCLWEETSPLDAIYNKVCDIGGQVRALHIHHSPFSYNNINNLKAIFPIAKVIDTTHIVEIVGGGFPKLSRKTGEAIDVRNVVSQGLFDYYKAHGFRRQNLFRTAVVPDMIENYVPEGHEEFSIGFVGRLSQQKRPYLIPVFIKYLNAELISSGFSRNVVVKVYGYGPYVGFLQKNPGQGSVALKVVEHCYDKNKIYGSLDCVVQLSENEGVSIVSYESASFGVPFLATDVGQQKEMVHPDLLLPARPRLAVRKAAKIVAELLLYPEIYSGVVEWQHERLAFLRNEFGYKKRMSDLYKVILER